MLPGQVRQQGCLCCLSTDLPLQGGRAKPAEAPVVGTILQKLEDREECLGVKNLCQKPLTVINLCQGCCFGHPVLSPLSFCSSQNHRTTE